MTPDRRHGAPVNGVQVPTPAEGCGGRTVPSAHVRCRMWSIGSSKNHRTHITNRTHSHCGRIVPNQPLLIDTVDVVPQKRIRSGGARLQMLVPLHVHVHVHVVGRSNSTTRLCRRRVQPSSTRFSSSTSSPSTNTERCSACPSMWVTCENESIALRPRK